MGLAKGLRDDITLEEAIVLCERGKKLEAVAQAARAVYHGWEMGDHVLGKMGQLAATLDALDEDGVERQETHSRCPECGQLIGDVS